MSIADRKEREKLRRREQILDAAQAMFQKYGWSEATMDQVAETAELSKGTLYLYFKDKEELYVGLGARGLLRVSERFQEIADTIMPAALAMKRIGEEYHRYFMGDSVYLAACHFGVHRISREFIEDGSELSRMHEAGMKCLEAVAKVIEKGIVSGEFRHDLNPIQTAIVFWSYADGAMTHQMWDDKIHKDDQRLNMNEAVWAGFRLLMQGIAGRGEIDCNENKAEE